MSDTNRNVTVSVSAKLTGSDPFQKMADNAARAALGSDRALGQIGKSQQQLLDRLGLVGQKMHDIGSGRGLVRESMTDLLGITRADRQVNKLALTMRDQMQKIEKETIKLKVTGDITPLLGTLRRMQNNATQIGRSIEGSGSAAMAGFGRVGGGVGDIARGLTMFGQNQDLQKTIERVLKLEAALGLLRGGKEVLVGLVSGFTNLTKTLSTISTASRLTGEMAQATGLAKVALAGQAAAAATATTATEAATVANTQAAESATKVAVANGLAAKSYQNLTVAAGGQAAGTMAARSAAAAAAARGGYTQAGGRMLVGGMVGHEVGDAMGHEWLGTVLGIGLGLGANRIGPMLKGPWAMARSLGMNGLVGNYSHTWWPGGPAAGLGTTVAAGTAAAGTGFGLGYLIDTHLGNPFVKKTMASDEMGLIGVKGTLDKMIKNTWSGYFGEGAQAEDRARERIARAEPIRAAFQTRFEAMQADYDRIRSTTEALASDKLEHSLFAQGGQRFQEGRRQQDQREKFQQAMEAMERPRAGADSLAKMTAAGNQYSQMILGGSQGTVETQAEKQRAALELRNAEAERLKIAQRLDALNKQEPANAMQSLSIATAIAGEAQNLLEAKRREADATRQVVAAERSHIQAERERLEQSRLFFHEQANHHRQVAIGERERLQGLKETYGGMNPMERARTHNLLDKLNREPGKGRAPEWRMVRGRWQFDPGTSGHLTPEEMQEASSNPFLQEKYKRYLSKLADQDQGGLDRLVRGSGVDERLRRAVEAEKNAKENEKKFTAAVNATITMDEGSFVNQLNTVLYPRLIQAVTSLLEKQREEMNRKFHTLEFARQAGARAVAG